MDKLRSKLIELFDELEGRRDTLFNIFSGDEEISHNIVLSESKRTMEFIGYLAMHARSIIPPSSSDDHSTKAILNDFMCDVSNGSKALNSNLSEMIDYEKMKMKFSSSLKEDQEASDIFNHDFNMLKRGLIGQNIQVIIIITRTIKEDTRIARTLFGRDWVSRNCKTITDESDNLFQ